MPGEEKKESCEGLQYEFKKSKQKQITSFDFVTSPFKGHIQAHRGRGPLLPQQKASHQGLDLITARQGERPSRQQSCPPAFYPPAINAPCRLTQERPSLALHPPPGLFEDERNWAWGEARPRGGEADETLVVLFELLITAFKADLASCLSFCVWLIKICTTIKGPDGSSPWTMIPTWIPVKAEHLKDKIINKQVRTAHEQSRKYLIIHTYAPLLFHQYSINKEEILHVQLFLPGCQ